MTRALDLLDGPFLGVGLGIDVHSESPDWRALLAKNAAARAPLFDFLEVYTRGEAGLARAVRDVSGKTFPLIYHHEGLDPVYPAPPRADAVAAADENLRALSAPWCVEELAYRFLDGRYLDFFMPAVLSRESVDVAVENVRALNAATSAPIVPENPPYQVPIGPLHILEYLAEISRRAEVPVVLDLGHLWSFQVCRGAAPLDGLDALPLERVIELHVAGAALVERAGVKLYEDLHGAAPILDDVLDMLAKVAPLCPHLRAVTIEVEDATTAGALAQAKQVKAIVARARSKKTKTKAKARR